jgi:hypothetical protein
VNITWFQLSTTVFAQNVFFLFSNATTMKEKDVYDTKIAAAPSAIDPQ